ADLGTADPDTWVARRSSPPPTIAVLFSRHPVTQRIRCTFCLRSSHGTTNWRGALSCCLRRGRRLRCSNSAVAVLFGWNPCAERVRDTLFPCSGHVTALLAHWRIRLSRFGTRLRQFLQPCSCHVRIEGILVADDERIEQSNVGRVLGSVPRL